MNNKRGYITGICDSDENAINKTKLYIEKFEKDYNIQLEVYIFKSAEELLEKDIKFDMILLDVELDGMSGMELAFNIRKKDKYVLFIFISACINYAPKAFYVQAFRFIIKPFSYHQFAKEIFDACNILKETKKQYLEILQNGTRRNIPIENIIYIESQHNRINIHIEDEIVQVTQTLKSVLDNNERYLCQVHKSYIINFRYFRFRKKYELYLAYNFVVPISKYRVHEFEEKYALYCKAFV